MGMDASTGAAVRRRADCEELRFTYCVVASGSGGNLSIVRLEHLRWRRTMLIDLGLAPRRAARELDALGVSLEDIDDAFLTHLDSDHFRETWTRLAPARMRIHVHAAHARSAQRIGVRAAQLHIVKDGENAFDDGLIVRAVRAAHDKAGVVAYRLSCAGCALGHATDVGRATPALEAALAGVDVLGIESNYCPALQASSPRPTFLKRRIMGGAGHLSNEQSAALVAGVAPSRGAVLLHLSRQCNRPEIALEKHATHGVPITLTWQHKPTPWIHVAPAPARYKQGQQHTPPLNVQGVLYSRTNA